jgi:phytoene dehydrogenase-like protein
MSNVYDAVVIGAGHNGLVCANYLARSGLRVAVLERRPIVGGAAVTEEIAPGFRASIFSYLMSLLHPRIIRDFDLKALGVEVLPCSDMVSPVSDTDYIVFSDNVAKTQASFAKFSRRDAEVYPAFDAYLREATAIVRQLLWETQFDPASATGAPSATPPAFCGAIAGWGGTCTGSSISSPCRPMTS